MERSPREEQILSALKWFVTSSSLLLFVKAYLRLCSQHIFLHSPNHFEPFLLVLRLASATPMSLWSSNLAMRSSSIQTSSTHLPRFQLCSRYSSSLLMQSQYVVMLFPSPWIFFAATLPPSADPVPPSTNKNRPMLTQYHHLSTSTACY